MLQFGQHMPHTTNVNGHTEPWARWVTGHNHPPPANITPGTTKPLREDVVQARNSKRAYRTTTVKATKRMQNTSHQGNDPKGATSIEPKKAKERKLCVPYLPNRSWGAFKSHCKLGGHASRACNPKSTWRNTCRQLRTWALP